MMRARTAIFIALVAAGCTRPPAPAPDVPEAAKPSPVDRCPEKVAADGFPGTRTEHETLAYWTERLGKVHDLDEVLLDTDEVARHNAAIRQPTLGHTDLLADIDEAQLRGKITERLDWMREQVATGKYRDAAGEEIAPAKRSELDDVTYAIAPSLHVALEDLAVRCGPRLAGYFKVPVDPNFDRNNCSTIHAQEPVQVVASWPGGLKLVRARYTMGWISAESKLSPAIPAKAKQAWVRGVKLRVPAATTLRPTGETTVDVVAGTLLPRASEGTVWVAAADGFQLAPTPEGAVATARPVTRRALLETAFSYLGTPYGWGGQDGGRDCSRFLLDSFASFGLELPRFSGDQAKAGTFMLDIADVKSDTDRLLLMDAAARRGAVLLFFPGHIMLYLGRDADGQPMAIHSFAEYLAPCEDGGETTFTNNRVSVTNLELGRGSSRRAFVERVTKIVVIGKEPGPELEGIAALRPAAPMQNGGACSSNGWGEDTTIYLSPQIPNENQPLRVIVTSYRDKAPGELVLWGPDGESIRPELKTFGGPPHSWVATLPPPKGGEWRVAFGDGDKVWACNAFNVRARGAAYRICKKADENGEGFGPVWRAARGWGPRTESLYAAFVEALFDYAPEDDRTWTNLHDLLRDESRNLLFNHLGRNEDARLRLVPDCADLPFFLRTYFAWKLDLPIGFRKCNRGRAGSPPGCGAPLSQKMPCEGDNDIRGFETFIRRQVGGSVHSGSGRTSPYDDGTDYYPVPLTREALRPGTVYADPYGHIMVVVRWVPQGTNSYGILIAADAQPDGTIGRRRFWRGTFLFTPDTTDVGAGFKAFRPVRNAGEDRVIQLDNAALKDSKKFVPYSDEQYRGTKDDFYDRMAALINPRPLDPVAMQTTLVDAFDESVRRRLVSVNNAVEYKAKNPRVIDMPEGYSLFETSGAWEDFSTPSRDMRLLIALDTTVQFPDRVARAPERYGIDDPAQVDSRIAALRKHMRAELDKRSIEYVGSDGTKRTLTLGQIVDNAANFEMAYNPNDCVEIRWGEPEGSPAMAACKARAPSAQTTRMRAYRPWFTDRQRPAR